MRNRHLAVLSAILCTALASLACLVFNYTGGPLAFEPETLSAAQAGTPYEAKIRITQNETPAGNIFISKGALPPGLEFEIAAGADAARIRGVPEEAGTFTFTVSAWCYSTNNFRGQKGEKEYSLVVEE